MPDARIRTLIVEDEPLARAGLRRMLAEIEWLECVGEAANGPAAIAAIDHLQPELVFLDIALPGCSGIEVLARIAHAPLVVFTTAYAEHAVGAFELGALDYLLKPFAEQRLHATLERVRAAVGEPRGAGLDRLGELFGQAPMTRLFVRSGRSIVPVAIGAIRYFEAVGDYIAAHTADTQHLLHVSLQQIESRLDARRFARIHRSCIVNLAEVVAFRADLNGHVTADLGAGLRLAVSRSKARELRALV